MRLEEMSFLSTVAQPTIGWVLEAYYSQIEICKQHTTHVLQVPQQSNSIIENQPVHHVQQPEKRSKLDNGWYQRTT
jgi:hypothetical protein